MVSKRMSMGLVLTGGTIACSMGAAEANEMIIIDLSDGNQGDEAHLVAKSWPGPELLDLRTRTPVRKLSENMTPADWLLIADSIRNLVEVDGARAVLVFHGTDTAAYTSAALSFLLADLQATVVVTGSNQPALALNSDAYTNVRDAMIAAKTMPYGVYLSFAGTLDAASYVHLGTTVRKARAGGRAYASPNRGPVARVENGQVEMLQSLSTSSRPKCENAISEDVAIQVLHPGIDLEAMADMAINSGKTGIVVQLYPCATGSDLGKSSVARFTQRCIEAGIVVVVCVDQYTSSDALYPSFKEMDEVGAVFAADMIPETAFVKLSWALAQANNPKETEDLFLTPIAGELSASATRLELLEGGRY